MAAATKIIVLAVAAALGGGAIALLAAKPPSGGGVAAGPVWSEVEWPFLMDQWGTGKAFQCKAADCGVEVNLYLRAKIGFCNCTTGVADDEELDRVGDVGLLGPQFAPLAAGRAITVGTMNGRSRGYAVQAAPGRRVVAIAFNERCDVIVATAVAGADRPGGWEPAVLAFLNSNTVLRWAEATLGL